MELGVVERAWFAGRNVDPVTAPSSADLAATEPTRFDSQGCMATSLADLPASSVGGSQSATEGDVAAVVSVALDRHEDDVVELVSERSDEGNVLD